MARRIGMLVAKASRRPELKQWNRTIEGKNRFPQVVRLTSDDRKSPGLDTWTKALRK